MGEGEVLLDDSSSHSLNGEQEDKRQRNVQARKILNNYLEEPRLGRKMALSRNTRFALLMNMSNPNVQLLPFLKSRHEGK